MLIDVDEIKVGRRIRAETGDLGPLMDSMGRIGLLHPITVNGKNVLVAGWRRLEAAKRLGWKAIDAVIIGESDRVRELEIELEENTVRSALSDGELMTGYRRLEKSNNPGLFAKMRSAVMNFFAGFFRKP
jgi:ParB family transcriptional regulator, chromosome partitioning protein